MATQSVRQEFDRFVKGLITEATELNFPADAAKVLNNFTLNAAGDAVRRRGVDLETSYVNRNLGTVTLSTDVVQAYRWRNVEGQGDKDHIVVQQGDVIYFFTNVADTLSDEYDSTMSISLSSHQVSGATAALLSQNPCSFTAGNGKLYINHKYTKTIEVTHVTGSPDTISVQSLEVRIRDFVGEDDGFAITDEPTSSTMNNAHWYNICNQGWENRQTDITTVLGSRGTYPSNAEQWQYGKYVSSGSGLDTWSFTHFDRQEFGNTRAPRGHYIIDAFNKNVTVPVSPTSFISSYGAYGTYTGTSLVINTSSNHGFTTGDTVTIVSPTDPTYDNGGGCGGPAVAWDPSTNLTGTITVLTATSFWVNTTGITGFVAWCTQPPASDNYVYKSSSVSVTNPIATRPQSNAFYAGRLFQSGVEEDGYNGHLYFSQIIQGDNMYNLCYQDGDPTAEHTNELVATDGGVIIIPDMQVCRRMEPFGKGLLLFADNGVWYLGGGEAEYFTAESYAVDKISNNGCISAKSVVAAEGSVFYWSDEGIYRLSPDEVSGKPKAESLTLNTIQTFVDDIPETRKHSARGAYNKFTKKIIWIYEDSTTNTRNLALVLDLRTNGFFPYTFGTYYTIVDVVAMPAYTTYKDQIWKFLTYTGTTNWTGTDLNNTDFEDFAQTDAAAEIQTGDIFINSASVEKQLRQMTAYMRRTETFFIDDGSGNPIPDFVSSCIMQPIWDWSDHTNSGKYGNSRELYRHRRVYIGTGIGTAYNDGYPVVISKNKVRGSGRSVRFKLTTTAGKDCQLLGWTNNFDMRNTE